MLFNIATLELDYCENYANIDFYKDAISKKANVFDNRLKNLTFVEILSRSEHNDFVIFATTRILENVLKCMTQPLTRFLIVINDAFPTAQQLTNMLNRTWTNNGALKVFITSHDKVFAFDPFHRNNDTSFGKLNSIAVSFESELKKLNGYSLRVELFSSTFTLARTKLPKSVDDFDGPDVNIAKMTSKVLNATILLIKNDGSKFGFRAPNGTFTGALNAIQKRNCDVAFVTFFIKDYETRSIEFSAPVYSDDLCLIVKKAGRIPKFILPLVTFDQSLWLALFIFYIMGVVFWCFLRYINSKIYEKFIQKKTKFNLPSYMQRMSTALQYIQIFVDTLILFLNAPLRRFPRVQNERIFTGAICLLSLNIVSIFQSGLATCYVKPMYYRNLQTLEEFSKTRQNILVKYPAMMADVFPEDSSELYRTLFKKLVLIQNTALSASDVTDKLNMAGITRKTTLKVQREDDDVHLIPECPRSYHLSYIYSKHWVLAEKVNFIILYLKQAGIIAKLIEDVHFRINLEKSKKLEIVAHHRVLRIDDLSLAFIILGGGCIFSFVLFISEIYFQKCVS